MTNEIITPINRILKFGSHQVSPLIYIVATVVLVAAFFIGFTFKIELYIFLALLALPLLWAMFFYPKVWIYCIVLTFPMFFIKDEPGITVTSLMGALFYNLFLICWFFYKIFLEKNNNNSNKKNSIVKHKTDVLILLFYGLVLLNAGVAVFNGVEPFDWLSEFLLFSLLLYYFPIREYFNDEKSIVMLLAIFFISIFVLDIQQFLSYTKKISAAAFAYQLRGGGHFNHQIFSAAVIGGVVFMFYSRTITGKFFAFVLTVFSTAAIVSTFARAFWGALLIVLFLLLFFLNRKQIAQYFGIVILTTGIIVSTIYIVFPKQANLMTKFVINKFSTSTQGKADLSVRTRLYEYRAVIQKIEESPIAGQGLRKEFSFHCPWRQFTMKTSFIHNGYLSLSYRVGIPIAALFYFVMIIFTLKGFITAWKLRRIQKRCRPPTVMNIYIGLAICGTLSLCMLFITNFVTQSFLFRDGLFVVAFSIAFIEIANRKMENG